MTAIAKRQTQQVGRPLKILIPMIQSELQQGNTAGREHYLQAGRMLREAREQLSHGSWGAWLTRNFDLSTRTAQVYMQWAKHAEQIRSGTAQTKPFNSLSEMRGDTDRAREHRQSKQHQDFRRIMRDMARDDFVQERQARDDEVQLHRKLAVELIDAGYHSLAKVLHPDRGGSKDAMSRLNRIRDELKQVAQTRRFV
jgi:hypothetical protein